MNNWWKRLGACREAEKIYKRSRGGKKSLIEPPFFSASWGAAFSPPFHQEVILCLFKDSSGEVRLYDGWKRKAPRAIFQKIEEERLIQIRGTFFSLNLKLKVLYSLAFHFWKAFFSRHEFCFFFFFRVGLWSRVALIFQRAVKKLCVFHCFWISKKKRAWFQKQCSDTLLKKKAGELVKTLLNTFVLRGMPARTVL